METQNTGHYPKSAGPAKPHHGSGRSGRVWGGLIVVTVGVIILAKSMGVPIPGWLFSWPMILIAVGLFIGVRHGFRGPAWFIMILVGTAFMLDRFVPGLDLFHYIWPIAIIAIGLFIMFKPRSRSHEERWQNWSNPKSNEPYSHDDSIESVNIFGGIKKNIISKNFRGGEITTIFGGSELNLTQADVIGRMELEVTQIFGGCKLIVPPHWIVQSEELVSIFGGVDDKRPPLQPNVATDDTKVLILKGTNIFGGIDIKSY